MGFPRFVKDHAGFEVSWIYKLFFIHIPVRQHCATKLLQNHSERQISRNQTDERHSSPTAVIIPLDSTRRSQHPHSRRVLQLTTAGRPTRVQSERIHSETISRGTPPSIPS
jgi:hypothetical protein